MTDVLMYQHIQSYRTEWYEGKAAVEEGTENAHLAFHVLTRQWVQRILPLDTVENQYQEIWHERQLGPYTGLRSALEDGLDTDSWGENKELLDVTLLEEIGHAAEEITVDAMDLPEQPPVDPDPWESTGLSDDMKERIENTPDYDYE
jgi:hypothetical protein